MKNVAGKQDSTSGALWNSTIVASIIAILGLSVLLAAPLPSETIAPPYSVDIFSLSKEGWLVVCSSRACSLNRKTAEDSDWLKVGTLPLGVERIYFADSMHGWCLVTTSGNKSEAATDLWGSKDGGKNWKLLAHPGGFSHFGIGIGDLAFVNPTDGWVIGRGSVGHGVVIGTNDGGETLHEISEPAELQKAVSRIFTQGDGHVWLVGNRTIAFTSRNQPGWRLAEVPRELSDYPLATHFESITFPGNGIGWIAGSESGPIILFSKNSGKSWELNLRAPGSGSFNDIAFGNPKFGCAVGSGGLVLCTRDGGNFWFDVSLPEGNSTAIGELKRVVILPSGDGWIISSSGALYGMKNYSGSWNKIPLSRIED